MRPVTIHQILAADLPHPDADFRIDGEPCAQITFVAQIRNISQQTTNFTYKLDDGTGTIEVKRWIDPDELSAMDEDGAGGNVKGPAKLANDMYVRVFGNLKSFNNKRHVGARPAGIRPVRDFNEVQSHLLEATLVHLEVTRGPLAQQATAGQANGQGGGAQGSAGGANAPPSHLSASAKRVWTCLRDAPDPSMGMHMQDMSTMLNMRMEDVQEAAGELVTDSIIFTTVDDNTFALMDHM